MVMAKWRSAAKVAPSALACLLAQGCVGVVFMGSTTRVIDQPRILTQGKPATWAVLDATVGATNSTAAWLRDHWGKPESIRSVIPETQDEQWTYKFGPMWYGVIPCAVVAVPLVVPLAREKVVFVVREGRVVSANVVTSHSSGAGASLFGPEGPMTW